MRHHLFPVAILAGGLATRLRPLSEKIPKALIEINGEPFIVHQLRLLKKQGIHSIVLCLGYRGEMIVDLIGSGYDYGVTVSYSFDGDHSLGTGGAIKKALPLLQDHFFVLYGDSYLPCDFSLVQTTFLASQKEGLMTIFRNEGKWDDSNVLFQDKKIMAYDKLHRTTKMNYIDYGLGIFNKNAFNHIRPYVTCDLSEIYQTLLAKNQLAAHEVSERFYEAGSFSGIEELKNYLEIGCDTARK